MDIIPPHDSPSGPGGAAPDKRASADSNRVSWVSGLAQPPARSPGSSPLVSPDFTSSRGDYSTPIGGPNNANSQPTPGARRDSDTRATSQDLDQSDSAADLLSPPAAGAPPPGYAPPNYQLVSDGSAPPPLAARTFTDGKPPQRHFLLRWWLPHYSMYVFLVLGVVFALGHHFYYASLDGKDASDPNNQSKVLRWGSLLSFLAKASIAAAAVTAFRQRVWLTVRYKVLTLAAVDSLFAATDDVFSLLNLELFRQAKFALLLALFVWCTPLVVIFTSNSLVVRTATVSIEAECPSVRTLNFEQEAGNEWRDPVSINDLKAASLTFWINTSSNQSDPNFFDYYDTPSSHATQLGSVSVFHNTPVAPDDNAIEICSPGWNCTYTVEFVGPGYKCTELASGVGSEVKKLGDAEAPFDIDDLAPKGNLTYMAITGEGEYATPQIELSSSSGIPMSEPPYPKHLGALRTEPVIWIGYAAVDDPSKEQPQDPGTPEWEEAYTPKIIGCEHYKTEYKVQFTYNSSQQHTDVLSRKYLSRVIDTTYVRGENASDGTLDKTTAVPESNYVLPQDVERYRVVAAYHSLGKQLRTFLDGNIEQPNRIARTQATQTRLIDAHSDTAVNNLEKEVPRLYEDMVLSVLANQKFVSVSWAADPDKVAGNSKGGEESAFPCVKHRTSNVYKYQVQNLWGVYSAAIFLCILAVAYGAYAVSEEGVMRTTRFSSIAAATRGPALEKIPWEEETHKHGGSGRQAGVKHPGKVKVGYGAVTSRGGGNGFALEGDVVQDRGDLTKRRSFLLAV